MSDKMKTRTAKTADNRITVRFNPKELAFIRRSCRRRNVTPSILMRLAIRELYAKSQHKGTP